MGRDLIRRRWFLNDIVKKIEDGNFIIGMVHLKALPGSSRFEGNVNDIYDSAIQDARALEKGGVSAILIENHYDQPFLKELTLEQTITMAAVCREVKSSTNLPIGIDAAFNQFKVSLAIAKAIGADFVRIPVFVDRVDSLSGIHEPACSEAIKYRKLLDLDHVKILADVQVKETVMLNKDLTIEESAKLAQQHGADAIIVTGNKTGGETPIETIRKVKDVVEIPVFVGSGVSPDNVAQQLNVADGAIVGSSLKRQPQKDRVDVNRVKLLMRQLKPKEVVR